MTEPSKPEQSSAGSARPRVLLDANVLMSRVQRDYFLYAASERIIDVAWSPAILEEMNRNLVAKRGVPQEAADKLQSLLTRHYPKASIKPEQEHFATFANVEMPDPDDRHVLAAAVAAKATILCTRNTKDFPDRAMQRTGISRLTPDDALTQLAMTDPAAMRRVHQTTVANNPRATSESTLDRLKASGAPRTAGRMAAILDLDVQSPTQQQQNRLSPEAYAARLARLGIEPEGTPDQSVERSSRVDRSFEF